MSRVRPLRGACNCGRIQYAIVVPSDATERAQIFFDDSNDSSMSTMTFVNSADLFLRKKSGHAADGLATSATDLVFVRHSGPLS